MILQLFHILSIARLAGAARRGGMKVVASIQDSIQYVIVPQTGTVVPFNKTVHDDSFDGQRQPTNASTPELSPTALLNLPLHDPEFPEGKLVNDEGGSNSRIVFDAPPTSSMTSIACTLGNQLGHGGFGVVYACWDSSDGKAGLAVKFITGAEQIEESKFEYDMQRRIQIYSDHVVKAKAAFMLPEGGPVRGGRADIEHLEFTSAPPHTLVIVMEMVEVQLYSILSDVAKWDLDSIMRIWLQVLDGLRAVHQAGLMWRDLKPENVLCTSRDKDKMIVKITDFGMAKETPVIVKKKEDRDVWGTPEYYAPEQLKVNKGHMHAYDEQVDVWELGILLYEMRYESTPFNDESPPKMYAKILNAPVVFPSRVSVPDEFKSLIQLLLFKEPSQRLRVLKDPESDDPPGLISDVSWIGHLLDKISHQNEVRRAPQGAKALQLRLANVSVEVI